MAWDMEGQKGKSASSQGYVKEGNIDVYLFNETPTRVRFLTEDVDIEKIMSEQKLTREEASEYVNTVMIYEKWIVPISRWEHTIPGIQGQRYFNTVICAGKRECSLCMENDKAKNNNATIDNKSLPYPVRKRFFVPAFFYNMGKILFVKGAQDFFEEIAAYISKNEGKDVDFEIYKTGKGFSTKYKSLFLGESKDKIDCDFGVLPSDLDFSVTEEEIKKKISIGGFQKDKESNSQVPVNTDETNVSASAFKIPFGTHKNKTISEVSDIDPEYLNFLSTNSSGLLQTKITEFFQGK